MFVPLAVLMMIALMAPQAAYSKHDWGGLDLCEVRRDVVPPGLDPALLPDAASDGARLMRRYCTQCHNLPGPGRHTAGEWPQALERMALLMRVSSRFRGLMGEVAEPSAEERELLRDYLRTHALRPFHGEPVGRGARAFRNVCTGCHVLPDPVQHTSAAWPAVMQRMWSNMQVMGRQVPPPETRLEVLAFLQKRAGEDPDGAKEQPATTLEGIGGPIGPRKVEATTERAWWALGPFLALIMLGLVRWGLEVLRDRKEEREAGDASVN